VIIRGNNKVISTSKIKKITAIKKKWIEKGKRAEDFGSNPHSKGEFFSRSEKDFFEIKFTIEIIIIVIIEITKFTKINILIIYTILIDLLIGS